MNIIYIMGTGRSATTIMEILLTNNFGITGVGEVTHIFRDGFIRNDLCSCGFKAKTCFIWGNVFDRLNLSGSEVTKYSDLFHKFDWHIGFLGLIFGFFNKNNKSDYKSVNYDIFKNVSNLTNCNFIVDSSKYASRAILLSKLFPGKVKVICLSRSPSGLIKAFKKTDTLEQKPKKLYDIVLYYTFVMLCCRIAVNTIGKQNCTVITFEQLMKQPYEVLSIIERLTGTNLKEAKQKILKNESFKIGHIVTGNRLRKKGSIQFKPSSSRYIPEGWVESISEKAMLFFGKALGFHYKKEND
ncbi:hypothetical protein [uncultured Desulfosarcina sp.]|uniref:hypothetical protein n=1 Tax=uncultured Desulfosarcina sp. TaxID=218289 RepID=UPI0029C6AAD8|nr:hypothetical protein [uncultured Desulfosarcina sp.]